MNAIFKLLFAPKAICMGCGSLMGSDENWLCEECSAKILELKCLHNKQAAVCVRCGDEAPDGICRRCARKVSVRTALSAYPYKPPIKQLVANFKFKSVYAMDKWMAAEMAEAYLLSEHPECDLIVPVPLHKSRLRERGYNQSEKLAKQLSKQLGIEFSDALIRARRTKQQATLTARQRLTNLDSAFACAKNVLDKSVLLIDDVRTTGTTCAKCAHTLFEAGAKDITILTFASAQNLSINS